MASVNSVEDFSKLDPAAKAQLLAAAGGNKELINAIQAKLNTMIGKSSGFIESLPPLVQARIEFLRDLQQQHDDYEEQFLKERAELEAKYRKLYEPLYAKRSAIVQGSEEIPPEQVEEATKDKPASAEPVPKGIPGFWAGVLSANEITAQQISEKDEPILQHLIDVRSEQLADDAKPAAAPKQGDEEEDDDDDEEEEPKGFRLIFTFEKNPFFSNDTLTKTYYMVDEEEPILERAEGTQIDWTASKNPTIKVLKRKAKPGKGGRGGGRPQTKTEPCPSFFNFFSPPEVPDNDEELEEEEMEALQNALEEDYDIGETIRDKLIPHAVSYYTGEAAESDDDDDEDYEDEGEGDEDDDEDEEGDDEDDDEDDEMAEPGAGGKAPTDTKEQPAECKQQ